MSLLALLRAKPDKVKSRIAIAGALSITVAIGIVWSSTLSARFSSLSENVEEGAKNTANAKEALTDLVAEVGKNTDTSATEEGTTNDSTSTFELEKSGLDALREERFDPTAVPSTTPEPNEMPSENSERKATSTANGVDTPNNVAVAPSSTPASSTPRMILIGTTTKPTP